MEMKGEGGGGRLEATPTVREGGREGGRRNLCMLQMVMGHLWRRKKSSEKDPASLDGMAQKRKFARQTSLPIRSSALFCMLTIYFLFSPFADHSSRRVSNPTDEGRGGKSRATDHPTPSHSTL